ncbi:MAG: DUF4258 domain-containing protein [Clostridium sp.]|uniref:DUF4258 domain-containing protein n=1 Tax=Clostridium sp. TaxID=1506 RepID=UPI0025BE64C7|nr:DUF4258 domain-containing protein [Clostridium sp.]MCE5220112.1 DUF4258 domain-containing protein [Clostridium sp.]
MNNYPASTYAKIHNNRRKHGKMINTFTLNNKTYSIRLTNHAEQRLNQRNIDLFQVTGSILSLGQKTITDYSGSNRDIFIMDKEHNFSVVCNITINTITIVTVIDNSDCWVKDGTIAVKLV